MPAGVEVVVEDGFATVTPEPAQRGRVLTALLGAVGLPSQVRTDTSGRRRSYVVLEQDARAAGLLDEPVEAAPVEEKTDVPSEEAGAPKAPAKKPAARKAPAKKADEPAGEGWQ